MVSGTAIDDIEENTAYRFVVKYYSENVPIENQYKRCIYLDQRGWGMVGTGVYR